MRRSRISALGEPGRRPGPYRLPRARRLESRRRLSGARHIACRRHHDAAGGDFAVLGARHHRHDRVSRSSARRSPAMSACSFPITPICRQDRPSSWSPARSMRCRSCSVRWAACSGSLCRSAISKLNRPRATREFAMIARRSFLLAGVAALFAAQTTAANNVSKAKSKRSPPSRSSAIWCAMSAATASRSRRWSDRTATSTSIRRRLATPESSRRPRSYSSMASGLRAG